MLKETKDYCIELSKTYTEESINDCWSSFKKSITFDKDNETKAFEDYVATHIDILIDYDTAIYNLL